MEFSLLHSKENVSHSVQLSDKILYHFSLDRSFSYICADVNKRKYFLSVISELIYDKNEIIYRQEIIKDFYNYPSLLEELVSLAARFEELRLSQKSKNPDEYTLNTQKTASATALKNILRIQAFYLKRALFFVKAFGEILSEFEFKSKGLSNLLAVCKEIYENPEFPKMLAFCSKYENFSEIGFWDFKFTLNNEARIKEYSLIDHRYIHVNSLKQKNKFLDFFKKTKEQSYPCEQLTPSNDEFFSELAISALSDISGLFRELSEQLFEKLGKLNSELVFYDITLKYIQELSRKNAPLCYPDFVSDKSAKVKKLYDLYLLSANHTIENVTPNEFTLSPNNDGILLFGDNGSGKTVYLRSIGTMQILAQAGLPIPCESAEITPFSQIATQFSESEKEFDKQNDFGRFEKEVKELAEMVDTLKEGALVFLNETFQSTSYSEGADGLYFLLKHFSTMNIRWILVSHLQDLEDKFSSDEVTVLHTLGGYKIDK